MVKGVLAPQRLRGGLFARPALCGGNTRRKRASRISLRTLVLATFALIGDAAYAAAFEEFVITSNPGDGYYRAGETIEVRADFDETVVAHNNPELRLMLTIGAVERTAAPITTATTTPVSARSFTFRYRVQDGDADDDGVSIAANAFRYGHFVDPTTDTRVNVAAAVLGAQDDHRVDAVRPEVDGPIVVTSDPGSDATYGIGDYIDFEVNFDDDIRVEGRPQLYLSIGGNAPGVRPGPLTRRATLVRTFARRLVFRYVVQGGDEDSDGLYISANALRGGTIEDLRGNPAIRALTPLTAAGHNVDGIVPTVQGVEIVSEPARGNTYGRGEQIVVEVTFSDGGPEDESVYLVGCAAGSPWLDLSIGTHSRRAVYATGSGTARLRFRYTVLAQDVDADGISIGANAMDTSEGCVEDAAGNALDDPTRIVPVQQQPNHRVDGRFVAPTATGVRILSNPPTGQGANYRLGDELRFAVDFNVPVHAREDGDGNMPRLIVVIGGRDARAALVAGSGTNTLTFQYMVQAGDADDDGISIGPNALEDGVIQDAEGNVVVRRTVGLANSGGHMVDAVRPAALRDGIEITSRGTYGLGEPIAIEVSFNEPVWITETDDNELELVLTIGSRSRAARFVGGSGTKTLRFRYIVRRGDSADGISIGPNALVGGIISDAAGNAWNEADRRLTPLSAQSGHRVDASLGDDGAPLVENVEFADRTGTRTPYGLGEAIRVEVKFTETVYASGAPTLALEIGAAVRQAQLVVGSGSDTLEFSYTVQSNDRDLNGVSIGPDALAGGRIVDAAGNEAVREFDPVSAENSRVWVDGIAPVVVIVEIKPRLENRRSPYGVGENIRVEVRFAETVHVTETGSELQLVLSIGEHSRHASYMTGSGSDTLEFSYTVQTGDYDDDGISIAPDALVGGLIEDSAGNDWGEVERRLPPTAADPDHRVDGGGGGAVPAVERVQIATRPPSGEYHLGESIDVRVVFDDEVYVVEASALRLRLSVGEHTREAAFVEGSGSTTLLFRYTIQDGDYDSDGISIGAGALVGGQIQDAGGNPARREFAALAAQTGHKVDARRPAATTATIVTTPLSGDTYRIGENIDVQVMFDEVVYVVEPGALKLRLVVGEHTREAAFVEGSGTDTLLFRYTVRDGDYDSDGVSIAAGALVGGEIRDADGNPAAREFAALTDDSRHMVDARRPVASTPTIETTPERNGKYRLGEDIDMQVTFDDTVYVVEASALKLRLVVGEHTREAAFVEGSGTDKLLFRYTVQDGDYDSDGISIDAGALVGGQIQDEDGNPARREFAALEADSRYKVDARRPTATTATIASTPFRGDTYRIGETIEVEVVFDEQVRATGDEELLLTIGEESKAASLVEISNGRRTLLFRYRVLRGDADANGIAIATDALRADGLADDDGNPAVLALTALSDQDEHKVDGAPVASAFEVMTLTLGQSPAVLDLVADVLEKELGIYFVGPFAPPRNTAPEAVSAEIVGRELVLTPRSEGTAQVVVTDSDCGLADEVCAIALAFVVTVQATPAEVAVLKESLAAVGRSLMAGAANTIGTRLEMSKYGPHALLGDRPLPRRLGAFALDDDRAANSAGGDPFHAPWSAAVDPMSLGAQRAQERFAFSRMLRGTSFEMPLVGGSSGRSSWALWGAGDYQTVAGKPEQGSYDGEVASVYLGLDGRGDSWVAGGAVARTRAEMDYAYGTDAVSAGAASGKGTVTTDLTAFHPYFQWSLGRKGQAWVMGGFGTGEVELEREGAAAPLPSDITMTMGMAGMRLELGQPGGLDFALRGDIGATDLETDDGVRALDDIEVSTQRARVGIEASLPLVIEGGSALTPFVDVGARVDEGDGETGNGVEVVAGVRYGGKTVRFEAKARQLVMHDAQEYEETGAAATLVVAPGSNGRGLSLSVAPRWGGAADATDMLWRQDRAFSATDAARQFQNGTGQDARWGVAGRIGYGLPLKQRKGTVTPFGEVDMSAAEQQRTRVGVKYAIDQLGSAGGMQLEFSGERVERERGTEHRLSVTAQGRF